MPRAPAGGWPSSKASKWRSPSPSKAILKTLTELRAIFPGEHDAEEWAGFLRQYAELLGDIPEDVAIEALKRAARNATWFPKPGEVRAHANEILRQRSVGAQPTDELNLHQRLDAQVDAWVQSFMRGDLGQQAIEEGWSSLLRGWLKSAGYQCALHAHQTGQDVAWPTTVPKTICDHYRAMRPPMQRREPSSFDGLIARLGKPMPIGPDDEDDEDLR